MAATGTTTNVDIAAAGGPAAAQTNQEKNLGYLCDLKYIGEIVKALHKRWRGQSASRHLAAAHELVGS